MAIVVEEGRESGIAGNVLSQGVMRHMHATSDLRCTFGGTHCYDPIRL